MTSYYHNESFFLVPAGHENAVAAPVEAPVKRVGFRYYFIGVWVEDAILPVTRLQARSSLLVNGLLSAFDLAKASAAPLDSLWADEATIWDRSSESLAAICEAAGITPEQIDAIFVDALKY